MSQLNIARFYQLLLKLSSIECQKPVDDPQQMKIINFNREANALLMKSFSKWEIAMFIVKSHMYITTSCHMKNKPGSKNPTVTIVSTKLYILHVQTKRVNIK